jgi:hypothetical protein
MELIQPFRDALTSDWQAALQRDEWFFAQLVEDGSKRLSPSDAFAALDEVATLLLQQHDPTLRYYCGSFLISLARRSDTTELPPILGQNWDAIMGEVPSIADQLRSWYRRPQTILS